MNNFSLNDASQNSNQSSQPMSIRNLDDTSILTVLDTKCERPPRYFNCVGELRSVEEIPQKYRHIFAAYPCFNKVQSRVMDDALYSSKSLVATSPTGSGKTVIFELAIIQYLLHLEDLNYHDDFKILYLAPMKALCSERLVDWHSKFSPLGMKLIEVTGDSDNFEFSHLCGFNLILSTPEKWDSITRRWRGNSALVQVVKLILIDEVQLLNEDKRGPILEAVVSRMKTVQELMQQQQRIDQLRGTQSIQNNIMNNVQNMRFVAISATIPNIEDIAMWLGDHGNSATFHRMGEELRPVQLNRIVLGYPFSKEASAFKFEIALSYRIMPIIGKYSDGKPTLIFVSTRNAAKLTSSAIQKLMTVKFTDDQLEIILAACEKILDNGLREMVRTGVAYHHAGMAIQDRRVIEELFRNGDLPVLIATNTLAMGVNLPARLVIVKGTTQYNGGETSQYSTSTVLQMIGRAGRPQFDTTATAVIMTSQSQVKRYEALLSGSELIESWLHKHLGEHLNAEVVLGTIFDLTVALQWVRTTFLYVRAVKNPRHYGLAPGLNKDQVEKKLEEMCHIEMNALARYGLLTLESEYGMNVTPTAAGKLMSKYYLQFESMKVFQQVSPTAQLEDLLGLLSRCKEYDQVSLRMGERSLLNTLNRPRGGGAGVRFPIPGLIQSADKKINCLIQAILGSLLIPNPALNQEAISIKRTAERVATCLTEYLLLTVNEKPCLPAIYSSLVLAKCLHAGIWENSSHVTKQFPGIGPALAGSLASAYKDSFKKLSETNPREIERILNKAPPMGNDILDRIQQLPRFILSITQQDNSVQVLVTVENKSFIVSVEASVLVGDSFNNVLMYETKIDRNIEPGFSWSKCAPLKSLQDSTITAWVISRTWVGLDVEQTLHIGNGAPPPIQNEPTPASNTKIKKAPKPKKTIAMTAIDKFIPPKKSGQNCSNETMDTSVLFPPLRSTELFKQIHNARINQDNETFNLSSARNNFTYTDNKQGQFKQSDVSGNVKQVKRKISQIDLTEEDEIDKCLARTVEREEVLSGAQQIPTTNNWRINSEPMSNLVVNKPNTNIIRNVDLESNITLDQSLENRPLMENEFGSINTSPNIKKIMPQWEGKKQQTSDMRKIFDDYNTKNKNIHDSGYTTATDMNSPFEKNSGKASVVHKNVADFSKQENRITDPVVAKRIETSNASGESFKRYNLNHNKNPLIGNRLSTPNFQSSVISSIIKTPSTPQDVAHMNKIQSMLNNMKCDQFLNTSVRTNTTEDLKNTQNNCTSIFNENSRNISLPPKPIAKCAVSVSRTEWSGSFSQPISKSQNIIKTFPTFKSMPTEMTNKNISKEFYGQKRVSNSTEIYRRKDSNPNRNKSSTFDHHRKISEILDNDVLPTDMFFKSDSNYTRLNIPEKVINFNDSDLNSSQPLRPDSKTHVGDTNSHQKKYHVETQLYDTRKMECTFPEALKNSLNRKDLIPHRGYSETRSVDSGFETDSSCCKRKNLADDNITANYSSSISYQANKMAEDAHQRRIQQSNKIDNQGKLDRISESQYCRRDDSTSNHDDNIKVQERGQKAMEIYRQRLTTKTYSPSFGPIGDQFNQQNRFNVPERSSKWSCYVDNSPGNISLDHSQKRMRPEGVRYKTEYNIKVSSLDMPQMRMNFTRTSINKKCLPSNSGNDLSDQMRKRNEIIRKQALQSSSRRPLTEVDANPSAFNKYSQESAEQLSSSNEQINREMRSIQTHILNREICLGNRNINENRRENQWSRNESMKLNLNEGTPSLQQFKYKSPRPKLQPSQMNSSANKNTLLQARYGSQSMERDKFYQQYNNQNENMNARNIGNSSSREYNRKCEYAHDSNTDLNASNYNTDEARMQTNADKQVYKQSSSCLTPENIFKSLQSEAASKGLSIQSIEKVNYHFETIRRLLQTGSPVETINPFNAININKNFFQKEASTSSAPMIPNNFNGNNPDTNYISKNVRNINPRESYNCQNVANDYHAINQYRPNNGIGNYNAMPNSFRQTDAYKLNADMKKHNELESEMYDEHPNERNDSDRNTHPHNSNSDDYTHWIQ